MMSGHNEFFAHRFPIALTCCYTRGHLIPAIPLLLGICKVVPLQLDAINKLSPRIPIMVDLWSVKEIAAYLKRSEAVVRERITALPGFPQAIRLPVARSKGRGQSLRKAKEVIV
jgi:hypothetical protein